jgi:DNA-binding protein HU-beta
MTKNDLIHDIADRAGLTRADAARALTATLEAISEALVQGDKVTLPGFGSFAPTRTAARSGMNPRTKERWTKAESTTVRFRLSKKLSERL